MANLAFKNATGNLTAGGGATTIYTVPALTTSVINQLSIANTYSTAITVSVWNLKAGTTVVYLAYQVSLAVGQSLSFDTQRFTFATTDVLRAQVITGSATADLYASVMEMS